MSHATPSRERAFPPIDKLADLALVLVICGGVYMATHVGRPSSLAPAWALWALAAGALVIDVVLLARLRDFAWARFRQVAGWSLVAYIVEASMIGFAFVYDGTRGATLVLVLAMLTMFALVVPLLLGFAVARYQSPDGSGA